MSFYIKKLILVGGANGTAEMSFTPGFNLIVGPSNVGKSVIFDSIDFAWGYEPRGKRENNFKLKDLYGYNHVRLEMVSDDGTLNIDRDVYNNRDKYTTQVYLSGTFVAEGKYPLKAKEGNVSLNSILLKFMHITEQYPILKNKKGNTEKISWRSIMHMFFLPQTEIDRTSSVLLNPSIKGNFTKDPALFLFLLHGMDARDIVRDIDKDPNKKIKDEAIVQFIMSKKKELETEIVKKKITKKSSKQPLPFMEKELEYLQHELEESMNSSEALINRIIELNNKLSQNDVLLDRMSALKSQYVSDIDRIEFVLQGQKAFNEAGPQEVCPYCGNKIHEQDHISFDESVMKNLLHIKSHLKELQVVENDLKSKNQIIKTNLKKLETERDRITTHIDSELRPRIQSMIEQVNAYTYDVQEETVLQMQESEMKRYDEDLSKYAKPLVLEEETYNILDYFDEKYIEMFESYLAMNFASLSFPNKHARVAFSKDLYDVTFDGKDKASTMGGGYTAVINATFAFSLQQFLHDNGRYHLDVLLMDSPLSQLSEKENLIDKETLKAKFLSLLMDSEKSQCIIAEHKEKMSEEVRKMCSNIKGNGKVNIIEFTGDTTKGRYGLLPGIHN